MSYCNKVCFQTKLGARIAAAKLSHDKGERYRAYFCEGHQAWHLTSQRRGQGFAKKNRTKKPLPDRKRLLLEKAEKRDERQVREIRQRSNVIIGSDSGPDFTPRGYQTWPNGKR